MYLCEVYRRVGVCAIIILGFIVVYCFFGGRKGAGRGWRLQISGGGRASPASIPFMLRRMRMRWAEDGRYSFFRLKAYSKTVCACPDAILLLGDCLYA